MVTASKKSVKHMADPYVHNEEHPCAKRWFLICKDNNVEDVKVAQPYLAALASAHMHGSPVPHFAKVSEYQVLIDPDFEPPPPKRRKGVATAVNLGDDEWAVPAEIIPKRKRKQKAPAKKEAPAPWEDKFEVQPGQESASEDDSSSSSSSSSSSGSSSSSSSSSRGSVAKSKEEVPDPVPAVRASQQRRLGKQQDTRIPFGKQAVSYTHLRAHET